MYHPWQCSMRLQGFRGRHKCGVTLLSGPTEDSREDPFVLVGAAHCNFICKDEPTGDVLETCCCRPENAEGSCRGKTPFCPPTARFTKAEPEDVLIVCGEFDTDVESIITSVEPEEVFKVTEIINHPSYTPNRVAENPNFSGGPIEGSDIAVYKVDTRYILGTPPTYLGYNVSDPTYEKLTKNKYK